MMERELAMLQKHNRNMLAQRMKLETKTNELRTSNNELFEKNKDLRTELEKVKRVVLHVREQKLNLSCQLGRTEKTLMEVRNNCAVQARDLHAVQSQVVWLAEWCQKKFGIEIGGMLGVADWPKRICEVVAKIVDGNCDSKLKQVGWYSPLAKDQISMQTKLNLPKACNHYSVPVFISEG